MAGETMLLLPGDPASDAPGTREEEGGAMIRALASMLVWNLIFVLAVAALW